MTRASLLHILDHVSEISDAEVRELEQLAVAFPYCQTAHLLLAKAAHDRGSMLAGQRLRRAATYATDRQLLRQLIELPQQLQLPHPEPATAAVLPADAPERVSAGSTGEGPGAALPAPPTPDAPALAAPDVHPAAAQPAPDSARAEVPAAADAAPLAPPEDDLFAVAAPGGVAAPAPVADQAGLADEPAPDELLPPAAPPIRPPADAGTSRFEFGLAEELPAAPSTYELAPLDEAAGEEPALPLPVPAIAGVPAFHADAGLGYGLGSGSRLGYGLQERDAYALDLPLESFFEPDALLLAHAMNHQPRPVLPRPSSTDLITQFLRNKPRLKAPAVRPAVADEQQDLSVRSTRAEPDLASESLARILVRQGKKDKAIEIYERLMLRQPEKKTYFADQIHQLKLSE